MNNDLYPVFAYGKWGAVDQNGNQVIPIIYTYDSLVTYQLSERGTVRVVRDDKYGILDTDSCKEIIPIFYDDIRQYNDELFFVLKNSVWYYWEKGLLYQIGEYDSIGFINEEFIGVENGKDKISYYKEANELDFVYSITEKKVIPRSDAYFFHEDLAIICVDEKYGFINRSLELVVPTIYDYVENFENGFAYVEIEGNEYYIDSVGHQVISGSFVHIDYSDDNCHEDAIFMVGIWSELACYEENGLIGLKSLHNRVVTLPIFDCIYLAYNKNNRYISVIKNGKYGVIDNNGNIVIECEYDYLSIPLGIDDIFVVCKYYQDDNGRKRISSLIDIKNRQIIPPIYNNIDIIGNTMAIIAIDNENEYKCGVLDFYSQELIIPLIYDQCTLYGDLFFVEKDGKWGYLNMQGNEIMKVEQDFDYSIYKDFWYYRVDGKIWGWEDYRGRELDFSKCSEERKIYFKDWKPITKKCKSSVESLPF